MPDHQFDNLGPFPILQFAAALLVIGGLALAIWRGTRDRKSAGETLPQEARWFFDGPLAMAINILRDIKNHQDRIVEIQSSIPEENRKQTQLLHDIKEAIERRPRR
jgi:hypothetical protein